jgi:PTS system glucose-specific IIC component
MGKLNNKKYTFGEIDYSKIKSRGSVKEIIAKLSRGLMLPIAMLPIAGLFLGIGSTIVNLTVDGSAVSVIGNVLKTTGNAVFSSLPVLFAIAIAISFTRDSGTAALSAFVG